jgi:hypothetical protein
MAPSQPRRAKRGRFTSAARSPPRGDSQGAQRGDCREGRQWPPRTLQRVEAMLLLVELLHGLIPTLYEQRELAMQRGIPDVDGPT